MNVGTEVEIAIGHRLMDYEGLCAHPHGHNYRIIVSALFPRGYIAGRGMYLDFKDVRRILNEILEPFDHSMMLRQDDPLVPILLHDSKARVNAMPWNPTAENFAVWIQEQLYFSTKETWTVRVYETSKSYAEV